MASFHSVVPGRRRLLRALAALPAGALLETAHAQPAASPQSSALQTRPIPSSGEPLPLVGLGSWITFNVGDDQAARDACTEVMRAFFAGGGRMVDSSPMYGSSQAVIGQALAKLGKTPVFAADKVWISGGAAGPAQIEASRKLWTVPRFDLLQVHNLLSVDEHLATLFRMKAEKRLRYVGITTSEGRRHRELETMMRKHPLDFVQLSYNLIDREVEQRLLPLAQERRIAIIVNRPFQQGELIDRLKTHPLPAWAAEIDCTNWAQVALKFVVSHPAVTCAIPATSRVDHVRENLGAARGRQPDAAMRARMAAHVAKL